GAPHLLQDGWLYRALEPMGLAAGKALAIAPTPPLMLSGRIETASWMPQRMPAPDEVFLNRVRALYADDAVLSAALQSAWALETEAAAAVDEPTGGAQKRASLNGDLGGLFEGAGKLLATADGPRVATLEASGWDTHVNQGAGDGQLARRLLALDTGIAAMQRAMGPQVWKKTAVLMATEFGRTVRPNGSGGTDHGTGGAAFLFGGAVQGGSVKAQWVGLSAERLKDGRDQPAKTDLRALFKGVLAEHMGVSGTALESLVFPDSASAEPLRQVIGA
ncbi:MAG: DUF1501 domain-containing protein, partial [Rhizomicrobium sp.]